MRERREVLCSRKRRRKRRRVYLYGIDITRWTRARRKKAGVASVQYLRYRRFFVLLATHGRHPIFQEEEKNIRDARRTPIRFAGYSISYRHGHPHVRLNQEDYLWMKAALAEKAVHRPVEQLRAEGSQGFDGLRPHQATGIVSMCALGRPMLLLPPFPLKLARERVAKHVTISLACFPAHRPRRGAVLPESEPRRTYGHMLSREARKERGDTMDRG